MRPLLLFGPVLAVGLIAAITALGHRGADPAFVAAQRHPATIGAEALSQAVVLAREPRPGNRGARGRSARCRAGAADRLGNPWRCTVRFASGRAVRYRIRLSADGAFHGANRRGDGIIDGRVRAPGSP